MSQSVAQPLPMQRLRELSRPNLALSLAATVVTWSSIIGAIWLCERVFHPVLYVIAVMYIANRQHSLLIQMHDGAHSRISDNRRVNEVIGELLCAWPMFFRMRSYRENHLLHHRFANTDKDPDFRPGRFPKSRKTIIGMLIADALALNTLQQLGELKRLKQSADTRTTLLRVTYYAALITFLTAFGLWKVYLLYWIVPLFTWLKVVLRLRAIADHAGVELREHPFDTRTVIPNWFDLLFIAPRHCSYHLGHHAYPSVPWFNLKKLHVELMKNDEFRHNSRITRGFWRLLLEFPWHDPAEQVASKPTSQPATSLPTTA
jgi:fatty acid desaturase